MQTDVQDAQDAQISALFLFADVTRCVLKLVISQITSMAPTRYMMLTLMPIDIQRVQPESDPKRE